MSENDNGTAVEESVKSAATTLSRTNKREDLATRTHYAFVGYFDGEDPTGAIRSLTKATLGASIALLRGEGATEANAYATEEKSELRAELESELESFYGEDSGIEVTDSVGPILPHILAYARNAEGVEESDAPGFEETSLGGD